MDPVLHLTLRVPLALLFAAAAVHKLREPAAFRAALTAYRLVPAWCAPAIVAVEAVVAVALCVPGAIGPIGATTLLLVYAFAIAVNLVRGRRDIDCGCAGPAASRPIGWGLVARNALLAVVALGGLVAVDARPLHWIDALTVVAATLAASALYAAADHLLALAPRARRAAA
jgi:hypothetical protein